MPVGAIPFPFGKCRICKDRATGVHYGVATCEGCKGFFKRSITKAEKYKCFFGGECEVTPKNRNRCKSCRFRLCLENGMSVEAVRMGRIPKIEKEKALEAVKASGPDAIGETYKNMGADFEECPRQRYTEEVPGTSSHNSGVFPGPSSGSMGPEIYDFDTGCISRKNHTIADDAHHHFPEAFRKQPDKGLGSLAEELPCVQDEPCATIGNNQVKKEFNVAETSSCHYYQQNKKNISMEIHESGKATDITSESNYGTYDNMNALFMNTNSNTVNTVETCPLFLNEDPNDTEQTFGVNNFQRPQYDKADSNGKLGQNYLQNNEIDKNLKSSLHNEVQQNSNMYPVTDHFSQLSDNTSGWFSRETYFCNQTDHKLNNNHDNSTITTSMALNFEQDKQMNLINEGVETVKVNEFILPNNGSADSGSCQEKTKEVSMVKTKISGNKVRPFPKDLDQILGTQSMQTITQLNAVQETSTSQFKSASVPSEYSQLSFDRPPSAGSSAYPPTCPTPSSIHGSTTSSQRSLFSPGLIRVLLEQVVDSTQEPDVASRLQQRLEENHVNRRMVKNILSIIKEVSAKRSKISASEETFPLSSVETPSEKSSLMESKMENIHRFLNDVNKFSRSGSHLSSPLHSPPLFHKQNNAYGTLKRQEGPTDIRYSCPPIKKRFVSERNWANTTGSQEKDYETTQSKNENTLFNSGLNATRNDGMVASCVLKPQENKFFLPPVSVTFCEQSKTVESSQLEEQPSTSNDSPTPCDMINQSINENEVTCSDDKLSREEVKKQIVKMTLEGLLFASKILFRMAPEHREKLRLWKLGLLKIRVLSVDTEEQMSETYQKIIAGITPLNERILGFCEQVPGFSNINADDRRVLIQRAYYDIWMLQSSEYFTSNDINIIMKSGEIYNRKAMEKILNKEITSTLMKFTNQFNRLNLSDLEVAILCAVRLTCSDDLEVKDRSTAKKLHSLMLDVLAAEIEEKHPENHTRLLIAIFELMPLLEQTNKMQCRIAEFTLDRHGPLAASNSDKCEAANVWG